MPVTAIRHSWSEIAAEAVAPGIERKFISGSEVTVARFNLERGGIVPRHSHQAEQMTCVLSGSLKFSCGGDPVVVNAGEVLQIPSWLEHEVEVLEDAAVIDVFSPVRRDWIDGTDDYFRR